eukprot:scaffold6708_cov134-Cylindrotheca_fusiformis.AAC.29
MNRKRNVKFIKARRNRIHRKVVPAKPGQPRLRVAAIRKRKFTNEESMGGMKKRIRLSEKPSSTMIILPFHNEVVSGDKHTTFFKQKRAPTE